MCSSPTSVWPGAIVQAQAVAHWRETRLSFSFQPEQSRSGGYRLAVGRHYEEEVLRLEQPCPTTDTPSHQTAGPGKAAAVARKRRLTCDQWEISASYPQPQYARLATHQRGRSQRVTRRGNALRLRQ